MHRQVSELYFSSEEQFMPNQILQALMLPMSSVAKVTVFHSFIILQSRV